MPHDVFISYATEDKATADAICAALDARGIRCWIASRDIMPSERYAKEIIEAIDASRVLVLVLSSNSNLSTFVASEVGRAFSKGLRIIPFRIEEVLPSDDLALFISDPQWLNALEPPMEAHLARLAETVERLLTGRPPAPPPPPPPKPTPDGGWKRLPVIITAVIVLALVAFAVWSFSRPKVTVGGGTTTQPQPPTSTQTQTTPVVNTVTGGGTTTPTPLPPAVNYEQLFRSGVEMLGDDSQNPIKRSEGVRLLGEVAASGDENWYWEAMKSLTAHVRASVPWHEGENAPPKDMPQDVLRALEVITARPPLYPTSADVRYKEQHRRDLRSTDLRGLRLVGRAHFEYADLLGANLDGAVLTKAEMEGVMLKDASLRGANLSKARMEGVDLGGADITQADLHGVTGLKCFDVGVARNWEDAKIEDDLRKVLSQHKCK